MALESPSIQDEERNKSNSSPPWEESRERQFPDYEFCSPPKDLIFFPPRTPSIWFIDEDPETHLTF